MTSEELSQLDSLLGNDGDGFSMIGPEILNAGADIAKTLFDAGSEAWGILLGRGVLYTEGDMRFVQPASVMGAGFERMVITRIEWSGDREGELRLILPALGAQGVVAYMMSLMLGESAEPEETKLDDDGMDAYGEAVNNFLGTASQALRDSLGGSVNLKVVEHHVIEGGVEEAADILGENETLVQTGQITIEGMQPADVVLLMPIPITGMTPAYEGQDGGDDMEAMGDSAPSGDNLAAAMSVKVPVCVVLAEKSVRMEVVQTLAPGSIIEFRKLSGELLDVCAGAVKFGEGEVVIVNEHFGIQLRRMTNIRAAVEA